MSFPPGLEHGHENDLLSTSARSATAKRAKGRKVVKKAKAKPRKRLKR